MCWIRYIWPAMVFGKIEGYDEWLSTSTPFRCSILNSCSGRHIFFYFENWVSILALLWIWCQISRWDARRNLITPLSWLNISPLQAGSRCGHHASRVGIPGQLQGGTQFRHARHKDSGQKFHSHQWEIGHFRFSSRSWIHRLGDTETRNGHIYC